MTTLQYLFHGRNDAHGRLERTPTSQNQWKADGPPDFDAHQDAPSSAVGVYPMFQSDKLAAEWQDRLGRSCPPHFVYWGCSDIDDGYEESKPLARNMQRAGQALGVNLHLERTKGKGFHVWCFAPEAVPAEVMRRALLAVHQLAGVKPVEVNPKQVDTKHLDKGLGNFVNLPYPYGATVKQVIGDLVESSDGLDWVPLTKQMFFSTAKDHLYTNYDGLWAAAKLYVPPPKPKSVSIGQASAEAEALTRHLGGLAWNIWKHGTLEGRDRSGTLARLAHLMGEEQRLTPADALVLLIDADRRWGKFSERADGIEQLERMIVRGYQK